MKKISKKIVMPIVGITLTSPIAMTTISCSCGNETRTNISTLDLSGSIKVVKMTNIAEQEATNLNNIILSKINNVMVDLHAELNTDYEILNLNQIVAGANIANLNISVKALNNSKILVGEKRFVINTTEIITTWENLLDVFVVTRDPLDSLTATNLRNSIKLKISNLLRSGQGNQEGVDYTIEGLNLIVGGANFSSYSDNLKVVATQGTTKLEGEFKVRFQLNTI